MASDLATNIVPFGKYKGQPTELMLQDTFYLQWLLGQDWFRERYATTYQTIINYNQEPTESPEHNSLQVLFLDEFFRIAFARVFFREGNARVGPPSFEKRSEFSPFNVPVDVQFSVEIVSSEPTLLSGRQEGYRCSDNVWTNKSGETVYPILNDKFFIIEIKPTVGDDYPNVIRQMLKSGSNILFTKQYTGKGATEKQFIATFAANDLRVVFLDQIKPESEQ